MKKCCTFGNDFRVGLWGWKGSGEMSEWFKEHAWKVCVLQKGTAGSNPALSAEKQCKNKVIHNSNNQNIQATL